MCFFLKSKVLNSLAKNKKMLAILSIILVSICAAPPIALKQVCIGEDMLYHMLRIEELSANILSGKIFPYIHSGALDGYGYGGAFFYPELMLLIPAIFYILGIDIINSVNISIVIYNILAGIISYICLKIYLEDILDKKEKNKLDWIALVGAIAYIVYPYRLYNIFYRAALNEFIAMCFIPLALLSMYKIFFRKEFGYWKMLSISFSLSLLTHLGTTLLLGIVGFIFFVLNINLLFNKTFIKNILKAILCAIFATSYFLFPMIEQMLSNEFFYTTLPKLNNAQIYANLTIDKKAAIIVGDLLSQPVLILLNMFLILILVCLSKILSNKIKNKNWIILLNSLLIFIYVFIMQTDIFPWKALMTVFPPIEKIQFPFRFFVLLGILFSLIISLSLPEIKEKDLKIKTIIVALLMFVPQVILSNKLIDEMSLNLEDLDEIDITWCLACGEYIPSKIDPEYEKYLKARGNTVKIKYKDDSIEEVRRSSEESHLNYQLDNSNNQIESVELPLIYYKGYDVKDNQSNIEIKESENGFIEINNIPKDKINVEIYYKGTCMQYMSRIITVVFLFCVLIYSLNRKGNFECIKN